jgi:hypothetical protein
MYIGILYNVFICLISGLGGIIVFILLQRLRRKEKREYSEMLDYTILAFGWLWLFSALRTSFLWIGRPDLDLFIATWFTIPIIYIHIALAFFYSTWALFKNKKIRVVFNGFFILVVLVALFVLFKYKPVAGEISYWGTKSVTSSLSDGLYIYGMFLPTFILLVIGFFRRLRIWRKTKSLIDRQLLGIHGSIIAYGLIAVFEGLSLLKNWTLLLVKIGIMICIFSVYLFATSDTRQ